MYQFKGFTEKANKALNLAIESAEEMRHNYVGTEHILYGLVKEGSGVAATALNECGVTEDALRENPLTVQCRSLSLLPMILLPVQREF
jgi:ATP-dependent Clp protease ATP-binding subunit ClpC